MLPDVEIHVLKQSGRPAERVAIPTGAQTSLSIRLRGAGNKAVALKKGDQLILDFGGLLDEKVLAAATASAWTRSVARDGTLILASDSALPIGAGGVLVPVSLPSIPERRTGRGTLLVRLVRDGATLVETDVDVAILDPERDPRGKPPVAVTWTEGPVLRVIAGERSAPEIAIVNHHFPVSRPVQRDLYSPAPLGVSGRKTPKDSPARIRLSLSELDTSRQRRWEPPKAAKIHLLDAPGWSVDTALSAPLFQILTQESELIAANEGLLLRLEGFVAPPPGVYLVYVSLLDFPGYDHATYPLHVSSGADVQRRPT